MGYRSKVIIGVKSGELSKDFDGILRKHNFPVDSANSEYLKIIDDPNHMKVYQFQYIKWYSSDDRCKEIMDWVHEASEDNDNAFCVGMGEDGSIHSEVGVYWDYVDVVQDINLIY
tara:strand:+ start:26 stop:370 length:345 start_codon:yes stop_codon:yes gene_type:complete